MRKRFNRPSEFRCLAGSMYALVALTIAYALRVVDGAVCGLAGASAAVPCHVFPSALYVALFVVGAGGLALTIYRAYRDFYRGDYYVDLADRGHL